MPYRILARPLSIAVLLAVLCVGFGTGAGVHSASAISNVQGDADCSGDVNPVDALVILRGDAGLGEPACVELADVQCDGDIDPVDSLLILRFDAGLSVLQQPGCTPIGAPLEVGLAAQLAAQLYAATDDEARYDALLKVMEVLRIGVYTSEGGTVQQGAERGVGDFYSYDFELRMMAASLGRKDNSWGVQQIADALDQIGYREDGQPFTGDDLNQILHEATVDSLATPEEASSLVPLLVRQLGLRHETPYDLADDLDVNEAQFDGLQMTLILVGLTLQVIADEGPLATPASTLVANSNGILKAQAVGPTDFCSDFKGVGIWGAKGTKFILTAVKKIGAVAKKVAAFIDIYHGEQLALSVQVKALDSSVGPTHYDHGSGSPGQNLKFQIEVRMLDDLGEKIVKCGWLVTADFPAKGGIPGVSVFFETDIQAQLKDHGTLDCTGPFCERTTGPNGIATLTFDPKSEIEPYGQGVEKEATGVVSGIAAYQSKFKNVYGTIVQFLTPKYGSTRWFVRYHGCPLGTQSAGAFNAPFEQSASIEAITGLDQLPCQWSGTAHASIHHYIAGSWEELGELSGTFTFGNPLLLGNTVQYEIISGSATWDGSEEFAGVCSFSDSGTHNDLQGTLIVTDNGSGHLTYDGLGGPSAPVLVIGCGLFNINLNAVFATCAGNWPLTDLDVSGNCVSEYAASGDPVGYHDEYDWHLGGISCSGFGLVTPEGVCGGAVAIPQS